MITYVTCDDVDNAFGNAWTSENAKNKAVLKALRSRTNLINLLFLPEISWGQPAGNWAI